MFEAIYRWKLRFQRSAFLRLIADRHGEGQIAGDYLPERETCGAVKGVARRVVIVSEPDPDIFEEAIFVVREDYMNGGGVGASEIMREAKTAAGGYVEAALGRPARRAYPVFRAALCVAAGVALSVAVWLALRWFAVL